MSRHLFCTLMFAFTLSIPLGVSLADGMLLADYTLNQTAADQTGNNPDVAIVNAPYEGGGVYLNGNYVGSDPDSSMVQTPHIAALDFSAFSAYVEFKVSDLPTGSRPLLICGTSWRYMGARMNSSGEVNLIYNGIDESCGLIWAALWAIVDQLVAGCSCNLAS